MTNDTKIIKSTKKTSNIKIKNNCNNKCTIENFAQFKSDVKKSSNNIYFDYIIYIFLVFILYQILKVFII
jgi:hypothetical protein